MGTSDYLSYVLWTKKFLEDQGYKLKKAVYYQDNKSAIKMQNNGWSSKGDKSRHIDIRIFFIKDVLNREKIKMLHCKTNKMLADYFNKPLQGLGLGLGLLATFFSRES